MRWEYKTAKVEAKGWFAGGKLDALEFDQVLNEMGDQGWELVSVLSVTQTHGSSREIAAVFKRPKQ
jgi:hypothetical protein